MAKENYLFTNENSLIFQCRCWGTETVSLRGLKVRNIARSSNSKGKWKWTLKSLLEATRMAVIPKMGSCRVLTTVCRFLNQSHKSPLYGSHHQQHFRKDQKNLNTGFFKLIFKMKDFLVQGFKETLRYIFSNSKLH